MTPSDRVPDRSITSHEEPAGAIATLLAAWQTALGQAAPAADVAAGQNVFAAYQGRCRASSVTRQRQDLALFARFSLQVATAGGYDLPDAPERFADLLFADPRAWTPVTWGHVAAFVQWLVQQGYAVASINHALSTVRMYVTLAGQVETIPVDVVQRVRAVRSYSASQGRNLDAQRARPRLGTKKAEATLLTPAQIARLKRDHSASPQGRRDAALMALLLDHGLRCSEIALLRAEHFAVPPEGTLGTFTFERPKVGKTQTHRLTLDSQAALTAYLAERHRLDPEDQGPLLCATWKNGELIAAGMTTRAINLRVGELGRRCGIANLGPHDCRHAWATTAIQSGTDIKSLQDAGGWASPHMPLRYAAAAEIANEKVRLG
jgi:site-specific recombinase XerC